MYANSASIWRWFLEDFYHGRVMYSRRMEVLWRKKVLASGCLRNERKWQRTSRSLTHPVCPICRETIHSRYIGEARLLYFLTEVSRPVHFHIEWKGYVCSTYSTHKKLGSPWFGKFVGWSFKIQIMFIFFFTWVCRIFLRKWLIWLFW